MNERKFKCIDTTWIKGIELGMIYSLSQIEDILDQIDERFNIERFIETFQEITKAEEELEIANRLLGF